MGNDLEACGDCGRQFNYESSDLVECDYCAKIICVSCADGLGDDVCEGCAAGAFTPRPFTPRSAQPERGGQGGRLRSPHTRR